MEISIKIDASRVSPWLRWIASDQMPFVCAQTLTRVAQDCQSEVRRQLSRRFVIRNTFVNGGIRIKPATKANLQSEVFTQSEGKFSIDFMAIQDSGGVKAATRSRNVAIPVDARRNKRDIVTRSNRPRALLDRQGFFISHQNTDKTAHLEPGVYKRVGKRRLSLMFSLEPRANIRPRWDYYPTILHTADERLAKQFDLAFAQAFAASL